jgi:FkbM family methyltransferase
MENILLIGAQSELAEFLYFKKVKIKAVADNYKFGLKFHEFTILRVEEAIKNFPDLSIVICVHHGSNIKKQLQELGVEVTKIFSFNEYCFKHEEFLPYMSLLSKNDFKTKYDKNLNYIKKVEELFFDKKSKYIYNGLFKWFSNVQGYFLENSDKKYTYFDPTVYTPIANEHLIDCGAYTGDSLLACPFKLFKYDGFEPDPKNYLKLINNKLMNSDNYKAWNCAVGASNRIVQLSSQNEGSVIVSNNAGGGGGGSKQTIDVEMCRVDSKIPNTAKPTIIKMDLEGYELEALEGCKKLDLCNTVFAITTYHKLEHLFEIPLMLHELVPSHKLFFRTYGEDWFETIAYAVPEHRIFNKR